MHTPRPVVAFFVAVVALLAAALPAAQADAKTLKLKPAKVSNGVAVFKLRGVQPKAIRRAKLRISGRKARPLSVRKVRRAVRRGRLRVRIGARRGKRAGISRTTRRSRLMLVTSAAKKPCVATFGEFRAGSWPGGCWLPYSDSSPFDRQLPANPRLASRSGSIVDQVMSLGKVNNLVAGQSGTRDDFSHPTYWGRSSDPLYRVDCVEDWGTCEIEGHQIHVPAAAKAAAGEDGHMTVVDQTSGWEYDLWQVRSKGPSGGRLVVSWGGRTRIDGDGLGSEGTAAHFGNLAGVIRAPELAAGEIRHALFMTIDCSSGKAVYPAKGTGQACSTTGRSNTKAPMGSRFQLNMSEGQIEGLNVPRWKKTVLHAMARYGMYFGDTGSGTWGIQFESGSTYQSLGFADEMKSYARDAGVPGL